MKKIEVHLHTNTNCNLYCIHCYNHSGEGIANQTDSPSDSDIIDSLIYLCRNYDTEIHLEGGEIFLRPELLKKMDSLPDDILKRIVITTNGTILSRDETILHMLRRISALRISVESADPVIHKKIRGCELQSVIANANEYKMNDVPVCIRMTLNQLNYKNFIHCNTLILSRMGFNVFQVYEFQSVGRGNDNCNMLALDNSLNLLIDELCSTNINGISLKMMFSKKRVSEILQMQQRLNSFNYRVDILEPEEGISIHANGDVYACAWENNSEKVIFNWYNDCEARQILNTQKLMHECENCTAIRITNLS